jgi:hypothetical protein
VLALLLLHSNEVVATERLAHASPRLDPTRAPTRCGGWRVGS